MRARACTLLLPCASRRELVRIQVHVRERNPCRDDSVQTTTATCPADVAITTTNAGMQRPDTRNRTAVRLAATAALAAAPAAQSATAATARANVQAC